MEIAKSVESSIETVQFSLSFNLQFLTALLRVLAFRVVSEKQCYGLVNGEIRDTFLLQKVSLLQLYSHSIVIVYQTTIVWKRKISRQAHL